MKKMMFAFMTVLLMLPVIAWAEGELNQEEACKILGNCADDSIKAAETMRTQCASMMELANAQMAKGMQIKTRGQMWSDKEMVAEGDLLIERGKLMLEQAKTMDEQCKLIIDQAKKSKEKSNAMTDSYKSKDTGKRDEPKL